MIEYIHKSIKNVNMFEAIHFEISFIFKKQVTEIGKSSNNLQ